MDTALTASAMEAGIIAALAAALALPAIRSARRALIPAAAALTFASAFVTKYGAFRESPLHLIGGHWNFDGKPWDVVLLLVIAGLFARFGIARGHGTGGRRLRRAALDRLRRPGVDAGRP